MQDFLLLNFGKKCLHPNGFVPKHLFSLKLSLMIIMVTVLKTLIFIRQFCKTCQYFNLQSGHFRMKSPI